MQDLDGDKSIERVIDLPILSFVFNDKGIVQIGDSIFKFTYDFTYKFHKDKLAKLKKTGISYSEEGFTAYPNKRKKFELHSESKASLTEVRKYYTDKKFLKAEINENNTVLYAAVTVDTKSRKKNILGIGVAYKVDELYVAGEGWIGYTFPTPGIYLPEYISVSDYKETGTDVQQILQWGAGAPLSYPVPYLISGHSSHWLRETSGSDIVDATTSFNE